MKVDVGSRLRALRKTKGLTTQQLANKVAVSQSYISRFENNRAVPDVLLLEQILQALDTDLGTFFATEKEKYSAELLGLIAVAQKMSPESIKKLTSFLKEVYE